MHDKKNNNLLNIKTNNIMFFINNFIKNIINKSKVVFLYTLSYLLILEPVWVGYSFIKAQDLPISVSEETYNKGGRVDKTQNGVDLYYIVTPDSDGVSNNKFNEYNVNEKGLILNNSAVNTNTNLGGAILGNGNLKNGEANVIINEVVSSSLSTIAGFTEVAGRKADVIVSNANGIIINGGGFINVDKAIFTTGSVDKNLKVINVDRGNILFNGNFNADSTNYFAVIGKYININAQVNANDIDIVAGSNKFNYSTRTNESKGLSEDSIYAIDVSALGSVYANRIFILATDVGAGVRNLGEFNSNSKGLTLTANGDIVNNTIVSTGDVAITGRDITSKDIASMGKITILGNNFVNESSVQNETILNITAEQGVINKGLLLSKEGNFLGKNYFNNQGNIVLNSMLLTTKDFSSNNLTAENITINASNINNSAVFYIRNSANITLSNNFVNSGNLQAKNIMLNANTFNNSGAFNIETTSLLKLLGDFTNSGGIYTNSLNLTASSFNNNLQDNNYLKITDELNITLSNNFVNSGNLQAKNIMLNANTFNNSGAFNIETTSLLKLLGDFTNSGGIYTNSLNLTASSFNNNLQDNNYLKITDELNITLSNNFVNSGNLQAKNIMLNANTFNNSGAFNIETTSLLKLLGDFTNSGGIYTNSLNLTASSFNNNLQDNNYLKITDELNITLSNNFVNSGNLQAKNIMLNANTFNNSGAFNILETAEVNLFKPESLFFGYIFKNDGQFYTKNINLTAVNLLNSNTLKIENTANINLSNNLDNLGVLFAENLNLNAYTLNNSKEISGNILNANINRLTNNNNAQITFTSLTAQVDTIQNNGLLNGKLLNNLTFSSLNNTNEISAGELNINFGAINSVKYLGKLILNTQNSFILQGTYFATDGIDILAPHSIEIASNLHAMGDVKLNSNSVLINNAITLGSVNGLNDYSFSKDGNLIINTNNFNYNVRLFANGLIDIKTLNNLVLQHSIQGVKGINIATAGVIQNNTEIIAGSKSGVNGLNFSSEGNFNITASELYNSNASNPANVRFYTTGNFNANIANNLFNYGEIFAKNDLTINTGNIFVNYKLVMSKNNLNITAHNSIFNFKNATIQAQQNLTLRTLTTDLPSLTTINNSVYVAGLEPHVAIHNRDTHYGPHSVQVDKSTYKVLVNLNAINLNNKGLIYNYVGTIKSQEGNIDISTQFLNNIAETQGTFAAKINFSTDTKYPDKIRRTITDKYIATFSKNNHISSNSANINALGNININTHIFKNESSIISSKSNINISSNKIINQSFSVKHLYTDITHEDKDKKKQKLGKPYGPYRYDGNYETRHDQTAYIYSNTKSQILAGGTLSLLDKNKNNIRAQDNEGNSLAASSNTNFLQTNSAIENISGGAPYSVNTKPTPLNIANLIGLSNINNPNGINPEVNFNSNNPNGINNQGQQASLDNGLFKYKPGGKYLIESNPLYTEEDNLLTSDYFVERLGLDKMAFKDNFLGDANWEKDYITRELERQTDKHFSKILGNKDISEAKLREILLNNSLKASDSLGLTPGIALSAEQINQLKEPIVWYVEQEIPTGGKICNNRVCVNETAKALVPVVYLPGGSATASIVNEKSIIRENKKLHTNVQESLVSNSTNSLLQEELNKLSSSVSWNLGKSYLSNDIASKISGSLSAETVNIDTDKNVILSGVINADNANIKANDLNMYGKGTDVKDDLAIDLQGNMKLTGIKQTEHSVEKVLHDYQDCSVEALGNSFKTTCETKQYTTDKHITKEIYDEGGFNAGNLKLKTKGNVDILGANVNVKNNADMDIAGTTTIGTVELKETSYERNGNTETNTKKTTHATSNFNVGGDLTSTNGDSFTLQGSQMNIGGNASIDAKSINVLTALETFESVSVTKESSSGFLGLGSYEKTTTDTYKTETHVKSGINIKGNAVIKTKEDWTIKASDVKIEGKIDANIGGNLNILAAKNSTYNRHDVKQTYNYWTIENNRDRDSEDYKLSVVSSNFTIGGGTIKTSGDLLVKGSNFSSTGNTNIEANDITVMGAYNYEKNTTKRGNRKRGSIKIEEDWSVESSNFTANGNLNYKLNKKDASGSDNTLEIIGSNFKVSGDVRGNVKIEKVKQREVHVSIQQNWDSGIIGMTKGFIGDIGQFLYESTTAWGMSDAIKRDYLESPNLFTFGAKEDQHTGIDTIDAKTSRHKESWTPLREDSDHDLVNIISSGDCNGKSFIETAKRETACQNGTLMSTLNLLNSDFETKSRIHDKQAGETGYDRDISYKIMDVVCYGGLSPDLCSTMLSIFPSFLKTGIAGIGNLHIGNITTNPLTGFGLFGGGANKNYNKTSEKTKDSNIEIGGKFYLDDVEISNGVTERKKVYGKTVISQDQAEIEKKKYFRETPIITTSLDNKKNQINSVDSNNVKEVVEKAVENIVIEGHSTEYKLTTFESDKDKPYRVKPLPIPCLQIGMQPCELN